MIFKLGFGEWTNKLISISSFYELLKQIIWIVLFLISIPDKLGIKFNCLKGSIEILTSKLDKLFTKQTIFFKYFILLIILIYNQLVHL